MITLTLHTDEVNFILSVLGELPTKTGCFPLTQKIVAQSNEQLPPVAVSEDAPAS